MNRLLRILPVWQNFDAEVERAKTHFACLPKESVGTPRHKQCEVLLQNIERSLAGAFPPQLYIWETFHEFYQNLLWLQSPAELLQQWLTLRDRIGRVDGSERGTWDEEFLKSVGEAINSEDDSPRLRAKLRTLRKFLDDRTDSALWQTQAVHESLLVVVVLICALLTALGIFISCSSPEKESALHTTMCAATLGATLSTLIALRDGELQGPPLARTYWPRPVIGAAAGLVLWFLLAAKAINLLPPASYALGVAFGFSERLFLSTLTKLGGEAEEQIGKVSGFGRSDSK